MKSGGRNQEKGTGSRSWGMYDGREQMMAAQTGAGSGWEGRRRQVKPGKETQDYYVE